MGATVTAPATPEAEQWQGWGTALKPSTEFWCVARKPLVGNVARNVLEHGTGAINVDGCRVESAGPIAAHHGTGGGAGRTTGEWRENYVRGDAGAHNTQTSGRWPPNTVFSHSESCQQVGTRRVKGVGATARTEKHGKGQMLNNGGKGKAHLEDALRLILEPLQPRVALTT